MLPAEVLRELEALCARVGLGVREEPFARLPGSYAMGGRGGGVCRVHGKSVVLVDAAMPIAEKIALLADALAGLDLQALYVPPFLRAKIEQRRRGVGVGPLPMGLAKARPRMRRST